MFFSSVKKFLFWKCIFVITQGQRNGQKILEQYSSCKPGSTLSVNYNNLVVPPDHVDVSEVQGKSVQLMWNFSLPKNIRNATGLILVRPEVFCVMYWKRGESMVTAKCKETKGSCFVRFSVIYQAYKYMQLREEPDDLCRKMTTITRF